MWKMLLHLHVNQNLMMIFDRWLIILLFQTPKILEAQEKRPDPASPLQMVIKEGSLGYKVDLIDGKVGASYFY